MSLENHVIVVVSPAWRLLEKKVLANPEIKKIKQDKQNGFYYVNNDKSGAENAAQVKADLVKSAGTAIVYQVYPVFNGHIDLDKTGASPEKKMRMPLYQSPKKDITEDEIAKFAAANHLG